MFLSGGISNAANAPEALPVAGSSGGTPSGQKTRVLKLISSEASVTKTNAQTANPSTVSGPMAFASSKFGMLTLMVDSAARLTTSTKANGNPTVCYTWFNAVDR